MAYALLDIGKFLALANGRSKAKDRLDFMEGVLSGLSAASWQDGTPAFNDGQAAGIAALGEARKRGVA